MCFSSDPSDPIVRKDDIRLTCIPCVDYCVSICLLLPVSLIVMFIILNLVDTLMNGNGKYR